MYILHALPRLTVESGGPARSVSALAQELASCGAKVDLLRMKKENEITFPRDVGDLDWGGAGKSRMKNHAEIWDIVHSHGLWLPFNHSVASLAKGHHIVSPRGMLEPWALNHSKWKKKLAWWLYKHRDLKRATAFHATAESEAESIRRLGFKQPIAVIPNGVQLPGLPQVSAFRSPPSKKRTALFLSRIHPKKGLPMLLDAWKKVAPEDWCLVIAGNDDGNHLPEVEKKIKQLGLTGTVNIVGPLFDQRKEEAYRNADLFVLPSYSENFGIVVTEALGYQVPVLTTKGCPWRELEAKQCGWWVDPTPEGIENGLCRALKTSRNALEEMGERGRKLVEEKYQWPNIATRMLLFYQWILEGGRQPDFVV